MPRKKQPPQKNEEPKKKDEAKKDDEYPREDPPMVSKKPEVLRIRIERGEFKVEFK